MAAKAEAPNFYARRIALQQRLHDFQRDTTMGIEAAPTDIISVRVEKPLDITRIPNHVIALLVIAGANTEALKLEYAFSQAGDGRWTSDGSFHITWKSPMSEGDDTADVVAQRTRLDGWQNDIRSISITPPSAGRTSDDWEVRLETNDKGSYVAKHGESYPLSLSLDLTSRLKAKDEFLANEGHRVALQEGLVELLDPISQPQPVINHSVTESDEVRRQREENTRRAEIDGRKRALLDQVAIILGKSSE